MNDPLAQVIATALEAARVVDEERIRVIVREELAAKGLATVAAAWLTPPAAAKALGVGLKRVRALIAAGAATTRPRNIRPGEAKQLKLEVNVASLEAALGGTTNSAPAPVNAAEWARQRAARGKGTA